MNEGKTDDNVIMKLTFEFALETIKYVELLEQQRKYVIAKQLFKAGTSIGANAREAQNAESKADFIHKFKIAAKEGDETEYWLLLCKHSNDYPDCDHLLSKLQEINKIMNKIIVTSKRKTPLSYLMSFFIF